ncbi:MAG TPA: DUF72 domain-containing protein [Gemmatimonadaceae bacterium]|nr:DUF72 domain-containing protein [Gemmatimonadaceae bacterium]
MNPLRSYMPGNLFVGTAGWSVPQPLREKFPETGTQLERYASVLKAVEINSSFHRSHMADTYQRWAISVPDEFRFSVKLPKTITHVARLVGYEENLKRFIGEVSGLGSKLGCLLVQLPPSLEFDPAVAGNFLVSLLAETSSPVIIEPRHRTWFAADASRLLRTLGVSRAAADPAVVQAAAEPGGSSTVVYFRLHGSPNIYSSPYTASYLDGLAFRLRKYAKTNSPVWCMFDNTMKGEAAANALYLDTRVALEEMGAGR